MPKKQTSPRLSSAAARLLAKLPKRCRAIDYIETVIHVPRRFMSYPYGERVCSVRELRSLLASLVSQDEQRGQKPKKKPKGKGRVRR